MKPFLPREEIKNWNYFWNLGLSTVKELETDSGILASGRDELYGAIFGRDSLITSIKLLKIYQQTKVGELLAIVRKTLLTLTQTQGQEINVQSGEEPGKIIHEFRPSNHEHLTKREKKPWFLYPDQVMRNYDSVDSTPLYLITLYRYLQITRLNKQSDEEFTKMTIPAAHNALTWLFKYGDTNNDAFYDYELPSERTFGGLVNQNWMDSTEATFHEDGTEIAYPIAPVEAQAYAYQAMKLWSNYFFKEDPSFALDLRMRATYLKIQFNEKFIQKDTQGYYLISGIDGNGKPIQSIRSNMGHCLWATLTKKDDGEKDGILEKKYVPKIVKRLLSPDLFEPQAGIRTLSTNSAAFAPNSYHNGSIWPHDNSIIADGFENYGYKKEALRIRRAVLKAISHFQTPVELYVYDKAYFDYLSPSGQTSCKTQAWSAAAILGAVATDYSHTLNPSVFLKFKLPKIATLRPNTMLLGNIRQLYLTSLFLKRFQLPLIKEAPDFAKIYHPLFTLPKRSLANFKTFSNVFKKQTKN